MEISHGRGGWNQTVKRDCDDEEGWELDVVDVDGGRGEKKSTGEGLEG